MMTLKSFGYHSTHVLEFQPDDMNIDWECKACGSADHVSGDVAVWGDLSKPCPEYGRAATIHPRAFVQDATIGGGTKVWQFASVIGATIGERCVISAGAFLGPGTTVGNDCFIAMSVSICNDMWPEPSKVGFDIDRLIAGERTVVIKDRATIGANAVILPGIMVGEGSFVAAGAVVDRDVPDGMLWRRNGYLSSMPTNRRSKRMRFVVC